MTRACWMCMVIAACLTSVSAVRADDPDWSAMPYTPHSEYQGVDEDGNGTFPLNDQIKVRGIILNRTEEMLDSTPGAPAWLGGQWQVYVQASDMDDFGGTACYMGQLYGNLPFNPPEESYTTEEWLAELQRLNFDPETGHAFRPGDLVEVRARVPGLFYGGKANVNEAHKKSPLNDFDFVLLAADCGVPAPTVITLSDVKDENAQYIFKYSRLTGCERYQATLVRINDVEFVDPSGWAPNATLTIRDATGRTFPVKLGLGDGFSLYEPPTPPFDVIALFDQEDTNGDGDYMDGYRLWITQNYNDNGSILPRPPVTPGDMNCDGVVDVLDVEPFALALLDRTTYESAHADCDVQAANCDGICGINGLDIQAFVELILP